LVHEGASMPQRISGKSGMRYGDRKAEITEVVISNHRGEPVHTLESGKPYNFRIKVIAHEELDDIVVGFLIRDPRGIDLYGTDTLLRQIPIEACKQGESFEVSLQVSMWLSAGTYFLTTSVARSDGKQYDMHYDGLLFEVIGDGLSYTNSKVNLNAAVRIYQCLQDRKQ